MELRDYQNNAIRSIKDEFASGKKRVLLCMPTGAGKTIVFAEIAKRTIANGKKVCIITHRMELFEQAQSKIGIACETITSGKKHIDYSKPAFLCMVETLNRREIPICDLYIIDEVHIGNFAKIYQKIPDTAFVLGVTATPLSNKINKLNTYYTSFIEPVTISDLVNKGFLAKCLHYRAVKLTAKDTEILQEQAGDYTAESQKKLFNNIPFTNIIEQLQKLNLTNKKIIVFNIDVEHSLAVTSEFVKHGFKAVHLDAETPKDFREQIIKDFLGNKIQILCNVGIATTGVDCPDIEVVVLNRKTKSIALYLQMIGRASRATPTKKEFYVLDMADNIIELGHWGEDRNMKHLFENTENNKRTKKTNSNNTGSFNTCGECGQTLQKDVVICDVCNVITCQDCFTTQEARETCIFCENEISVICPKCKEFVSCDAIKCVYCNHQLIEYHDDNPADTAILVTETGQQIIIPNEYESNHPLFSQKISEFEALQKQKGYKYQWIIWQIAKYGRLGLELYAKIKRFAPDFAKYHKDKIPPKNKLLTIPDFITHKYKLEVAININKYPNELLKEMYVEYPEFAYEFIRIKNIDFLSQVNKILDNLHIGYFTEQEVISLYNKSNKVKNKNLYENESTS